MASLVAFQPKVSSLHLVVHVALVLVGLVGWGHWTRSCVLEAFQRSSSVDVALPVLQVRCIHWAPPPPFFPEVGWVEEDEQEVFHSAEEGETRLRGQPGSEHLCTSRGRRAILQVRRRYLRGGFGEDLVLTCLGTPPPPSSPTLVLIPAVSQTTPFPLMLLWLSEGKAAMPESHFAIYCNMLQYMCIGSLRGGWRGWRWESGCSRWVAA